MKKLLLRYAASESAVQYHFPDKGSSHKKTFPHRPDGVVKTVRCKVMEKNCARNEIARKQLKCMKYFEDLKTSDGLHCS